MSADYKRINRSRDNRLYLISTVRKECSYHFSVGGTTGKIYYVVFSHLDKTCSCADFVNRHKPCKHIYFVLGCALHFEEHNISLQDSVKMYYEQIEFLAECHILPTLPTNITYMSKHRDPIQVEAEDECGVCFEKLMDGSALRHCRSCGKSLHSTCADMCLVKQSTCPFCRGNW